MKSYLNILLIFWLKYIVQSLKCKTKYGFEVTLINNFHSSFLHLTFIYFIV